MSYEILGRMCRLAGVVDITANLWIGTERSELAGNKLQSIIIVQL